MKYFKKTFLFAAVAVMALGFTPSAFAQNFAVIVNAENAASADASDIKNLYLKKRTAWSDGTSAVPLARSTGSAEQEAFLSNILGMSQSEIDSYWASEKSKTGSTGPREVGSSSILLRQVGRKAGAFGIVSTAEASSLPEGVKVLLNF